jgi:hypothetical protein
VHRFHRTRFRAIIEYDHVIIRAARFHADDNVTLIASTARDVARFRCTKPGV